MDASLSSPPISRTRRFLAPFKTAGNFDWLVIVLFLAINLIVLVNAVRHNPEMGYDAIDHLAYIQTLPDRLPGPEDTNEYFSAPLPYILPSLVNKACLANAGGLDEQSFETCRKTAGKFSQGINVLLSLGATYLLLQICIQLRPGSRTLRFSTLALLGTLTVYYKTFAQVRGEPYVVLFTAWALYLLAKLLFNRETAGWKDGVGLGVILGLLILSRQWGFMLFPALGLVVLLVLALEKRQARGLVVAFTTSLIVAFLVGGWFYLYLYARYDTFLAFNEKSSGFSFANQPYEFYRHTGLDDFQLFREPTRRVFDNMLIPIFYSEMWGDYWGYMVFIRDKSYLGLLGYANQAEINPYLGRVNLVSLYPTLLFAAGLLTGALAGLHLLRAQAEQRSRALFYFGLTLFVLVSAVLYLYFLISYPFLETGTTIKATYLLHGLLVLTLLGAEFLEQIRSRWPRLYPVLLVLLLLVWAHNLPAMISRYFSPS